MSIVRTSMPLNHSFHPPSSVITSRRKSIVDRLTRVSIAVSTILFYHIYVFILYYCHILLAYLFLYWIVNLLILLLGWPAQNFIYIDIPTTNNYRLRLQNT